MPTPGLENSSRSARSLGSWSSVTRVFRSSDEGLAVMEHRREGNLADFEGNDVELVRKLEKIGNEAERKPKRRGDG